MITHVTLLVDASGSMGNIREEAISMYNAQLRALKIANEKTGSGETLITLISFNDDHKVIFENMPVEAVPILQDHDYLPQGGTAMYDSIAFAVERQLKATKLQKDDAVLFVIITDGEENSSILHKDVQYVKGMLDTVKATGQWTVAFMGTEDALKERNNLGVARGLSYTWDTDAIGNAISTSESAIHTYYCARIGGETATGAFFEGDGMPSSCDADNVIVTYTADVTL